MNTSIRRSTLSDLDLLENIEREAFAAFQQSSKRALKQSLKSAHQQVWIAEVVENDLVNPVGCLILYIFPKTLRIFSIAVFNRYKGMGIGKILLDHAESIAKEKGIKRISLELNKSSSKLLSWYEEAGFKTVELLPNYYDEGIDGLRMVKNIQN